MEYGRAFLVILVLPSDPLLEPATLAHFVIRPERTQFLGFWRLAGEEALLLLLDLDDRGRVGGRADAGFRTLGTWT